MKKVPNKQIRYTPMRYKYRQKRPVSGLVNGIRMDLLEDLDAILDTRLTNMGIQRKNVNDPTMDYCRLMRRLIEQRPRTVCKAATFQCPAGYEKKLQYLENCIRTGKNLNPFLTKNVKNLKREDMLLYDWNIFHFHISDTVDAKSGNQFMERSDYLLMAHITEDAAYFIEVVPHRGETSSHLWANRKYLQIVKDNWPELLERYQLRDMTLSETIDEKTHYELRNAGALTFTELEDGSLYGMIGGGYASDKSSTDAVRQADYLHVLVSDAEKVIAEQFWELTAPTELAARLPAGIVPHLELVAMGDHSFILIEQNMRVMILMKNLDTEWRMYMAGYENSWRLFERKL